MICGNMAAPRKRTRSQAATLGDDISLSLSSCCSSAAHTPSPDKGPLGTDCAVPLPSSWYSLATLQKQICPPCVLKPVASPVQEEELLLLVVPEFFRDAVDTAGASPTRRVSSVSAPCKPVMRQRLRAAVKYAHDCVGSAAQSIHPDAVTIAALVPNQSDKNYNKKRSNDRQQWSIVGICVAAEISRAFRAHCADGTTDTTITTTTTSLEHQSSTTEVGDVWCSGTAYCGVQLVWVAAAHRRRGVAERMIDTAREHVCYGYVVPREHVAFWEPTAMGSALARTLAGRQDFLVF